MRPSNTSRPTSDAAFPLRRHLVIAGLVFLLALGVRLLFLLTAADRSWPHSVNYEGDAVIWARAAHLFALGQVPDEGVPHRFYAIAHLMQWFGAGGDAPSYLGFKVAWCVLSAFSCAAVYLTLARNLPRRPTAIATVLCVFSFGSYVLATSLNVEGLYVPLLMAILGGTLELLRRPSWWLTAALGAGNALALLTREEHLVLLVLLAIYLWWRWRTIPMPPGPDPAVVYPGPRRRLAIPALVVLGAVSLCLPYSVHATRATAHYNSVPREAPDYEQAAVPWSPEARAFIDSLPAFVRAKTVELVSRNAADLQRQGGAATTPVSAEEARRILVDFFGYLPDPLATPVFIASHGPMSFALSNHPASNGGFSRAGLETGQQKDPRLNLTLPEHLRIFNHGYAVGWSYIMADKTRWLSNVLKKLGHAYQGVALGFTAYNLPLGRYGERRPCDLLTPLPGAAVMVWQLCFAALLMVGARVAWRHPLGRLCLLVIGYKVLIVVVYYGYARQTVSILPVFLVLVALGVDQLVIWVRRRRRPSDRGATNRQPLLGALLVFAALVVDVQAALHPPVYDIVGTIRPLPQVGASAFSANARIDIRARGGSAESP